MAKNMATITQARMTDMRRDVAAIGFNAGLSAIDLEVSV
jgi:hypothetical protein